MDPNSLPDAADYLRHSENWPETLHSALSGPCLYYPGAGKDVDPAVLFANSGIVSTVVYVDYLAESLLHNFDNVFTEFERVARRTQFSTRRVQEIHTDARCPIWRLEETGVITAADMGYSSPEAFYPNTHTYAHRKSDDHPEESLIGRWGRFHNEQGAARPLMFLYFFTEAIQTYINLWGIHGLAPLAVVVQNHSKGCCWTPFHSDSLLYAAAPCLPKYLYVGNLGSTPWPGYRQVSQSRTDHNSMHHSERALFQARTPFASNPNSPLNEWNGQATSLPSQRYPKFHHFKLVAPETFHRRRCKVSVPCRPIPHS